MAKKTLKKQPLKAAAKTAAKTAMKSAAKSVVKTVAKLVKKVSSATKSKPSKPTPIKAANAKSSTVKGAPLKKEEKLKKALAPAPVLKKMETKKAKESPLAATKQLVKEMNVKGKVKSTPKPDLSEVDSDITADETANDETLAKVATKLKPIKEKIVKEKPVKEKKKTAAQKKKEKLEIDSNAKWADLFEKYKQVKPLNYSMRDGFEANQPIQHKVLGWGWVMSSENDRLEVLFKDGKKILISNYKS